MDEVKKTDERQHPIEHRENFIAALTETGKAIRAHIGEINTVMLRAVAQNQALERCHQKTWGARIERMNRELSNFERCVLLRPSLCVMGRRGAGKTTLLNSWLGKTKKQKGVPLKALPYGTEDTTACLVRITSKRDDDTSNSIEVSLLDKNCMSGDLQEDSPRPPRPDRDFFKVRRDDQDRVFCLARFPVYGNRKDKAEDKGGDETRSLQEVDGIFVLDETGRGAVRFEDIQWHAREICIPMDVRSEDCGRAGSVLSEVDIVDSPGADSTKQGDFGDWKKVKNTKVFQVAVNELDMLLLTASSQPSSINIGGQFQEDVMYPWARRCRSESEGRLFVLLTHATELFKNAMRALDEEEDEEDIAAQNNSFGRMLYKNILMPLFATAPDGTPPIVQKDDITTWPPIFFYDRDYDFLNRLTQSVPSGSGAEMAERLCGVLDGAPLEDDLSDAERCVLSLVQECGDIAYENRQVDLSPFKRWLVRSLCAFLDPSDKGLELLTESIVNYASRGPVAIAHAREREKLLEDILASYKSFLGGFSLSRANFQAEEEIAKASKLVRKVLGTGRYDQKMHFGQNCRRLLEQASQNNQVELRGRSRPACSEQDVLNAVVSDTLQNELWTRNINEEDRQALSATLRQCLLHTPAIAGLFNAKKGAFEENRGEMTILMAAALERIPGIVEFLRDIDDAARSHLAQNYFEADPDEMELLREIYESHLAEERPEVSSLFEQARSECAACLKSLQDDPVVTLFENTTSFVKEDVQS